MSVIYHVPIILLIIVFASLPILADTWGSPQEKTHCSANERYCLKVIPKKSPGQLKPDKTGAEKEADKNVCRGIFMARDSRGNHEQRWEVILSNKVSPVKVLVSDEGDYVITFDNWHNVGYGDNVVAIYDARTGKLIRKMGLADFLTKGDISKLRWSVSSIWWGDGHRIDYEKKQLVLRVTHGPRIEAIELFLVHVDLATGRVLDEIKDRILTRTIVVSET